MSNRRPIAELTDAESLDQVFLVRDKELRTTRSGEGQFVTCTLADSTGTIPARLWQANEAIFGGIPSGGFMRVKGRVETYRGKMQIIIEGCRPVAAEQVDMGEFVRTTDKDIDAMWGEMVEMLQTIHNEPLRRLIKKFLEDHALVAAVKRAPAAMQMHHPFAGGLVEHTLGVMRGARAVCELYPSLNRDLMIAGAFLHDIAKSAELSGSLAINYTDRGQLVGHITIAAVWIQEKAAAVAEETGLPIPHKTINLLQHLVLSHHGVHEYGSPKLPAIPEAFALHYVDNLDAKIWMTDNAIDSTPDPQESFTSYLPQLESRIYRFSDELEDGLPTEE
jgi:3'-5' exoribonuclease